MLRVGKIRRSCVFKLFAFCFLSGPTQKKIQIARTRSGTRPGQRRGSGSGVQPEGPRSAAAAHARLPPRPTRPRAAPLPPAPPPPKPPKVTNRPPLMVSWHYLNFCCSLENSIILLLSASQFEGKSEEEIEMMKTMGFGGFDTTKVRFYVNYQNQGEVA